MGMMRPVAATGMDGTTTASRTPPGLALAAVASVAVLASGCGSSSPATSTPSSRSQVAAAAKYTTCLRRHGLSNFPDPKAITENGTPTVTVAFPAGSTNAPQFNTATDDCRKLYPSQRSGINPTPAQLRDLQHGMLAFARCVRAHGVSNFPDPPSPQSNRRGPPFPGVDWRAPAVQAAGTACIPVSHGVITPALLQRFETVHP